MARNVINLENVVGYAKYGDDYTNIIEEQRKKKKKQQEKEDSWTDFSAFEDGYQLGDVTKAILGTGVKTGQNFTKGLQSNLEGLLDFGTNVASMGTEALGLNNATEKLRNFAQKDFIAENDLVNKTLINTNPMLALLNQGLGAYDNLKDGYDPGDLLLKNNQIATLFKGQGTLSKGLDKIASNSITGNKLDSLAQTVGQISGQAALGSTGIPWQLTAFANSAGGEMNNAFQNNATAGQAFISGLISGAVEVGTEYIGSGANKLLGMESLGSKALGKLGSKISNKVVNRLLKIGIDASSEGLEEVLSGLGTAIGQKLTYMNDKELEELYSKDQALDDFIMGALGTIITNVPGQVQSIRRGENALSGLTENEQTVLDKVIEQRTNEAQKDGKELTKKQLNEIEEQAREDLQNGYISADTIEETLGDNYNADKDVMLRESFNERARRRTNFNTNLEQYKDENQRKIVQKAIDSGILNDSKKTHNFVDLVSKIAADKGMDFDFVNNQKIKDSGFGVEGKTVNGYVNGNTIGLNIESNNALNKTVGHEITHVLEGSDMYQALQDSLRSYVGEGEWQSRLKSLSETYKNVENADVTKELTADLVGENLFNNENFVRSLSTKDRNLFEKIYDEIKYLVKIATAGSKEARDLEKVKRAFEKAYRETSKEQQGTQYSLEQNYRGSHQIEDGTSIVNLDLNNIRNQIEEIDGYITRETEKDFNKLKKILNNPDENVKIYRAAPVGELNNGDWVTTDKNYAKNVANNNGGKVYEYEVKANELNYPSNIKELPSLHRLSSFQYTGENQQNVKYSLTDNQNNESEKITLADGRTYNNYYEYAKDITKNKDELAKELLFKHYSQNFDVPANSNETKFYHGTDATFDYDGLKVMDFDEQTMDRNYGDYFYITTDKDFSHTYGSQIAEFIIPNDKILSLEDYRQNYSNKTDEELFNNYWALEMPDNEYIVKDIKPIIDYSKQRANDYINQQENTQYSLTEDNQGRELSKEQQEYFKDSKIRNENGELETVYHTTPNQFTVFDSERAGENTGYDNTAFGSFVTTNRNFSERFGDINEEGTKGNTMEMYANITNPITHPYNAEYKYSGEQLDNIVENWFNAIGETEALEELKSYVEDGEYDSLYQAYRNTVEFSDESPFEYASDEKIKLQEKGYDGVEFVEGLDKDVNYNVSDSNEPVSSYAVFDSNQLKNIDNSKPTSNPDIRYSLSEDAETFTTPYGVEVVKNPSNDDYIEMRKEILDEYPWLRGQEPILRHTYDEEGNEYYWSAYDAQHASVEPYINKKYDTRTNQNDGWWKRDNKNDYPKDYSWMDLSNFNPDNTNYSLSRNEDIAPTRGWEVRGEDIRLQNAIAPLQEQVQELQNTIEDLRDNIAPITEEEADLLPTDENIEPPTRYNLTEQESKRLDFLDRLERENMLTENLAEERNELMAKEENAPELGKDMTPIESLNDVRDMDEAARDRKVNAYQYEHPEVKPYFQEEARILKSEINNVIPGERFMIEGRDYEHPTKWYGYKRQASEDVANLLDGYTLGTKYTKDQLIAGLDAIIEDHGLENKAVSKRLEFMLDDRLRNGYETIEGYQIEPNQQYLEMLREQSWDRYYEEAPIGEAPVEEPTLKRDELEDLDVDISPFQDMIDRSKAMEESNTALQTINNNREQITQDLVSDGLPQDAAEATIQNVLNKYDTNKQTPKKLTNAKKMELDAKEKFVNRNAYVDQAAKDYKNERIKWRGDIANNAFGEARYNIDVAQTDLNGNEIGKSVDKIFEPYKKQGLLAVAEDYLFNRSNIERHKVGKGSTVPIEVSQRLVKDYLVQYPQLKNLTEDIQKYYDNFLQLEVDSGLIDQSQYNFLRGEKGIYRSYVPFYPGDAEKRYFDNNGNLKPAKTLKRAKGGASKIMGIQEAMRKQTMAVWNSMRTNQLYQELVNTMGGDEGLGAIIRNEPTNLSQSLYTDTDGTKYLTAYVDGREVSTKISEELYNELSRNNESRIKELEGTYKPIVKALQWVSNLRRNLLTSYNPLFALYKNPVKDIQDAALYSKHTARMMKNLPTSYIELLRNKSPEAKQFRALYGGAEYKGIGKLYAKVSEAIELAPRFAEFKASREAGDSVEQAIYNAREVTTNFGRGGYITKAMNRNGFTFLNASVQGFDKFIRNFSEQPNAKSFAMACGKAAMLGIVPAIFNHLAFGTDDDKDEDYEALPNYIKDNYYLFKMGNGEFVRIPKGRALSVMGSAARRVMEASEGDEEAFKGYLSNAWSQIGPVELGQSPLDNTILAPIAQALGGKKTEDGRTVGRAWYGGDIVPTRLQDKPSNEQYDEKTDKFSIWLANTELGKKLGISPKKLNYVLNQYSGGIGDVFLPMLTEEASSDAESLGEYLTAPIKNELIVDSVNDNKYVSNFYSKRAELTTIANGENATDEEKLQQKYMDDISWEMSALYKEKREIQSDPNLSKKEKYERATEIKREINELSKSGLEGYKNVSAESEYADVNSDKSYYKDNEGSWKSAKEEDVSSTETYGLTDREKNTYYSTKNKISNINAKYKDSKDYAGRRKEIVDEIINANMPDNAKIELYNKSYKDKNAQSYVNAGIKADDYLTFKSQTFTADKDKNGKSISGSKKQKVFDYIQNMNIPFTQKVILAKTMYPTYNEYNQEVVEYLNKSDLSYDEMVDVLEDLGFKVNGDNVSW